MKKLGLAISLIALSIPVVHAGVSAQKGSKATLKVRYEFASEGNYFSSSKDQKRDWKVRRVVDVTAVYAADQPQPFGAMHQNDQKQKSDIDALKAKAAAAQAKSAPMMADTMKIVSECNGEQSCIEKRVSEYANAMPVPTDIKERQAEINEMARPGLPRFQLWRSLTQDGTYSVNEHVEFQVYEMTCTNVKICKRITDTTGGGPINDPAEKRSTAGASMFEVDAWKGDAVIMLPVPLALLPTQTKVVTTIPGDPTKDSKGVLKPMLTTPKPITVTMKGDKVQAAGTQRIPIEGQFEEGGLLTITWSLSAQ